MSGPASGSGPLVRVAVPVPFLPSLRYRIPPGREAPAVGSRVRVPLGKRAVVGCVIGIDADSGTPDGGGRSPNEANTIREVVEYLDDVAFLPHGALQLALWVAEYYACGPGDAVAAAMPPFAWTRRGTQAARVTSFKTERVVRLSDAGHRVVEGEDPQPPGHRQRAAMAVLADMPSPVSMGALVERGGTTDAIRGLLRRGLVLVDVRRVERDPFRGDAQDVSETGGGGPVLTEDQQAALRTLSDMAAQLEFRVALLHGVTGSGKTELYLRLAQVVSGHGRRVLVLVPEIVLAPAIARRFDVSSASASQYNTADSPTASVTINGIRSDAAISMWSSGPDRPCLHLLTTLGWWSSTRNTMGRTSRRTVRGITVATRPSSSVGRRVRLSCWGLPRRRWRRITTRCAVGTRG